MNSTARRVPRITGLPARILGSTTMRSDGGITTVYRVPGRLGSCTSARRRRGWSWLGRQPGQRNRCNESGCSLAGKFRALPHGWPDKPARSGVYSLRQRSARFRSQSGLGWTTHRVQLTIKSAVRSFGNLPETIDPQWLAQLAGQQSPSETKGISRWRDTGKSIDSKWATETGLKSPSPYWNV